MTKINKKSKLTKEEREQIDNKVVTATAIALVGAMLLLFLQNWSKSIYATGTMIFIKILMWVGVAAVVACLVAYFVTKNKKYLFLTPYFAVGSFMFSIIPYGLHGLFSGFFTTNNRFLVLYVILAVYLLVSYIYYGLKLRK